MPTGPTIEIRLFGGGFWEVYHEVSEPVLEARLWLFGEEKEAGADPTTVKGRRNVFCGGCGDTQFVRAEVSILTLQEFTGLECFATEVEDLRKALHESPESFSEEARRVAQDYVQESDESRKKLPLLKVGDTIEEEHVEVINRVHLCNAYRRILEIVMGETPIEEAKREMLRKWQSGGPVPPPLPGRERGLLDPFGAPRFIRLTCADCGRWTVLLPFGEFEVPEGWWGNPGVPNPEVVRVQFDSELKRPMACILDGVPVDVVKTERFVQDPLPEWGTIGCSAAGTYHVETTIGPLTLQANPVQDEHGQLDWEECEWHAEFGSEAAAAKWRELKQKETTARRALAYQIAEAQVRVSDARALNERAYAVLFQIENLLRLRVIEVLEARYAPTNGPQWWKAVLPQFVKKAASNRPHFQPKTAMELLECLTLAELGELIGARWKELGDALGGEKSRFDGWIQELTQVRNDVMHSRPLDKRTFGHLMMCVDFVRGVLRRPAHGPHQDDSA